MGQSHFFTNKIDYSHVIITYSKYIYHARLQRYNDSKLFIIFSGTRAVKKNVYCVNVMLEILDRYLLN